MKKEKHKFKEGLKWNIAGSLFYEATRLLNQIFLLKNMSPQNYGLMGAIFSAIYFSIFLLDLGFSQILPTFINIFIKSKKNFNDIFLKKYIYPQILIFSGGAIIFTIFYNKSFLNCTNSPLIFLIPGTIIFEGLRIFFRRFLHNIFITKTIIIFETVLASIYLLSIWIPNIFFNFKLTLNLIFLPYFITSGIALLFFILIIKKFYNNLPEQKLTIPPKLQYRIIRARLLTYTMHAGKNFFTGNFLTPFFASQFGFEQAGIFNLASNIAESIKAITKSVVIFSGGGLFAKIKSSSIKIKKHAFKLLSHNLNNFLYPVIIFIIINNKFIFQIKYTNATTATTNMAILFFLITATEFFFMAYEQFYIIEENIGKLFLLKLIELLMFYIVITTKIFSSPASTLIGLLVIKITNFFILALDSFVKWKIKPYFCINKKLIFIYITASFLFYFLIN